jgi:phi13 family phage major tail protein
MESTYYPLTGIEEVYIAEGITDTSATYSAGTPEQFSPAESGEWTEDQNAKDAFYNNQHQDVFFGVKKTSIKLVVSGVSDAKDASIRGIYHNESTGRTTSTGNEEPPDCAFGMKMNKGKSDYVYVWFPKVRFSGGTIKAQTKTNDVTLNTIEYTITVLSTTHLFTVNGESKGITYHKGDTTTAAFDATSWWSQVQTPETDSTPSAIALSSIVPADDAPSIAVDTTIVLTFNNKISSDSVTVISAAGAFVSATKSYDTTGKILTITPASDLSASTTYIVSIAGVTDIYGQSLAGSATNFTTAS